MGDRASVIVSRDRVDPSEVSHPVSSVGEVRDLRQLRMFQSLAQSGSFTETAVIMSVTQSAVSHSIKSLETTLGIALFDRSGKTPTLTRDGEIFLASASEVLREMGRVVQKLDRSRKGELMTLRIGSADTIAEFVLPDVLVRIHQEFPEADLDLTIGDASALVQSLNDGSVDILLGIQNAPTRGGNFQQASLFRDSLRLIIGSKHPWVVEQTFLDAECLTGGRLLLFGEQSTTNQLVLQWLERAGIHVEKCLKIGSIGALKKLVACGFGVGLAPEWVLTEVERRELLRDFAVPDEPIHRDWCISMRKTHTFSALEKRFIVLLKEATLELR
ncbi:MAG: DNA-binding transcriptional LysR family regulator [Verrucomicrobiales bacterium]